MKNESDDEFVVRICSNKERIGSWEDVASIINTELGKNFGESKYRKDYQTFQRIFEANRYNIIDSEKYIEDIRVAKEELQKERYKLQTEKLEYFRQLRYNARDELFEQHIIESVGKVSESIPLYFNETENIENDKEAVIFLADWHYGMTTDNIWNKYNTDICRQRIEKFSEKCVNNINLHTPSVVHIVLLGDFANGAIHTTSRIASEEDVCDQLMHVSELIAQFVNHIANCESVIHTNVYSTYGNHMRTIQNKKESVHSDNLEKIIPWWVSERLSGRRDISIIKSEYKEFIKLNVCGYNICCVHGDLDNVKNLGVMVNTIFTKKFNETIDYTVSADKHHTESFESFNIENIIIRSMCGTDNYANDKRLYSNPGQTIMFFTPEDGKETVCDVCFR